MKLNPEIDLGVIGEGEATWREILQKFDYVFTSGGIGPTHDDITAESISKAFDSKYEIHKKAFEILGRAMVGDEEKKPKAKRAKKS